MINFKSIKELAKVIDSTNLKNNANSEDIEKLANDAKDYGFYSVMVSPYYVSHVKKLLEGSNVKIGTVVGFPLGYNEVKIKELEAKEVIKNGANELDMVINILALKTGDLNTIKEEIESVVALSSDVIVKVIIETGLLNKEEVEKVSLIAKNAGADFIKTSTGFDGVPGANANDINLIKKTVPAMKIKASGGINNYKTAFRLLSSGADRIGTSSAVAIIDEFTKITGNYDDHADNNTKIT
jgi:deoxyribose-phosphate aldolase